MKVWKKTEGSMVIEGALVMPFFLAFVLALLALIQLSITDMALRSTASESTKQLAVHMYAGSLLMNKFSDTEAGQHVNDVIQKVKEAQNEIADKEQLVDQIAKIVPEFLVRPLVVFKSVEQEQRMQAEQYTQLAAQSIVTTAVSPYVKSYANSDYLHLANISVERVQIPLDKSDKAFVGIEISYKLKLQVPFFNKEVTLHKRAYERAWIGNQGANQPKLAQQVNIVSISPNPVFRGGQITLKAVVPPHSLASIKVKYKSGISVAQGLSAKQADAKGNVSWDWKVGGSTTAMDESGIAVVEVGDSHDGVSFDVQRRH